MVGIGQIKSLKSYKTIMFPIKGPDQNGSEGIKVIMDKISNKKWFIITIISITIYSIIWSIISIDKYCSLNASVYDLGFSMQNLWFVTHEIKSPYDFYSLFISKGILYILFPLYFIMRAQVLLVLQSLALGLGALPIYGIAQSTLKSKKISSVISIFYLIYFPMAGINWFDFHYQMFFIILFLSGYYFYTKERYGISVFIFALSGLVRYPYYIFPLAFSFIIILKQVNYKYKNRTSEIGRKFPYMILLFLFELFLFVSQLLILNGVAGLSSDATPGGIIFNIKSIINGSVVFFYLLFPLIFLPLFSKKWAIFMLPFAFLVFTRTSYAYSYPNVFQYQYTSMVIPFIWLGFIDVLGEIKTRQGNGRILSLQFNLLSIKKEIRINTFIIILVTILMISSAMFFEPYSPLNVYSTDNFNTSSELNINQSQLTSLNRIVHLIPNGNPYVFVQNNLPQAMYGHFSKYIFSLHVPNASINNISSNSFPYYYGGSTPIDYVVGDVNNYNFYTGDPSMMIFAQKLFESGYYKMVAASNGIFLLARINLLNSIYFKEYNITIKSPSKNAWVVLSTSEGNLSAINNIELYQKYSDYLLPGTYSATIYMYSYKNLPDGNVIFQIDNNYDNILSEKVFSLNDSRSRYVVKFELNLTVGDFYPDLYLNAWGNGTNGSLYIEEISLKYIKPIMVFVPIPQLYKFYGSKSNSSILAVSDGGIFYHGYLNYSKSLFWNAITLSEINTISPKIITISNYLIGDYGIQCYLENLYNMGYVIVYSNATYEILEKDVSGESIYIPALFLIPADLFDHYGNAYLRNSQLIDENLTSNDTGWFGPNILLFSGNYTITFLLSYKNSIRNDTMSLDVYYPNFVGLPHNVIVNSTIVKYKSKLNSYIFSISLNFSISQAESYVQFRAMNMRWNGLMILKGAILKGLRND